MSDSEAFQILEVFGLEEGSAKDSTLTLTLTLILHNSRASIPLLASSVPLTGQSQRLLAHIGHIHALWVPLATSPIRRVAAETAARVRKLVHLQRDRRRLKKPAAALVAILPRAQQPPEGSGADLREGERVRGREGERTWGLRLSHHCTKSGVGGRVRASPTVCC